MSVFGTRVNSRTITAILTVVLSITAGWANDSQQSAKSQRGATAASVDCLVLEQRDLKVGRMTVYLGKDRVRVDAMNGQATIVARAPSWNVLLYNRDHQFYRVPRKTWHEKGLEKMNNNKRRFFATATRTVWRGIPAIKCHKKGASAGKFELESFAYQSKRENQRPRSPKSVVTVTHIASSNFGLSKGAAQFAEGLYLTPPEASIMLETNSEAGGETTVRFNTDSAKHKQVPSTMFDEPTNLTQAASLTEVITGKGIEQMMLHFSGSN